MIRRLVEQSYFERSISPTRELLDFWLRELRTPQLLAELVAAYPEAAHLAGQLRPAVQAARQGGPGEIEAALEAEEQAEPNSDRQYWTPLKKELEALRLARKKQESS